MMIINMYNPEDLIYSENREVINHSLFEYDIKFLDHPKKSRYKMNTQLYINQKIDLLSKYLKPIQIENLNALLHQHQVEAVDHLTDLYIQYLWIKNTMGS